MIEHADVDTRQRLAIPIDHTATQDRHPLRLNRVWRDAALDRVGAAIDKRRVAGDVARDRLVDRGRERRRIRRNIGVNVQRVAGIRDIPAGIVGFDSEDVAAGRRQIRDCVACLSRPIDPFTVVIQIVFSHCDIVA